MRSLKPMDPGHHEYPAAFGLAGETTVFQHHELRAGRSERVRPRRDKIQNQNIWHAQNQRLVQSLVGESPKRTDQVAQRLVLSFLRVPYCESNTVFGPFEFDVPPVVE